VPLPPPTRQSIAPHLSVSLFILATDCSASGDPLKCRLTGVLHLLYLAAAILAIAAIVVLLFAIRTYRKNRILHKKTSRIPDKKTNP
jgi:hypothetical protein